MTLPANQLEHASCVARVGFGRPLWAVTRGARCGARARDWDDAEVDGKLGELALCRVHSGMLRDAADPSALVASWTL